MACNVKAAIALVENLKTSAAMKNKQDDLDGIIARIRALQLATKHELALSRKSDVVLSREYSDKVIELVKNVNNLVETKDGELVFKRISYGVEEYVAGEYDPVKNTIKVAIVPTLEAATQAAAGNAEAQYYKYIEDMNVSDEELSTYMAKDPVYAKLQQAVPEEAKELLDTATKLLNTEGIHALTHEYIHAGAVVFMKKYPEHAASKRIKDIFEKVQHKRYAAKFAEAGVEDYWKTNVDEFLAEALSNPKMMVALNEIKLNYGNKLVTALQEMVDAIMQLLGFKQNGSAYEFVLDGFAAIVEAQKAQNDIERSDPTVIQVGDRLVVSGKSQAENKLQMNIISKLTALSPAVTEKLAAACK